MGNGVNGAQAPAWARTIAWLVRDIGFPSVVALFLLAMLGGYVESPALVNQYILREHIAATKHHVVDSESQLGLLAMICENTSDTELEKIECRRWLNRKRAKD